MIEIRKSEDRGQFDFGWLQTKHSFSFGEYYDPQNMGWRALRVINDDAIQPGQGFGTHPHRDMEIVTYVTEGALAHKDSMGNGASIHPGEVQRMSAGDGVTHSEYNHEADKVTRLLQIWILPEEPGGKPGYEQKAFPDEEKRNRLRLVASRDGRDGSVRIKRDVEMYASLLDAGAEAKHELREGRAAYVQVVRGGVELNGIGLKGGDGAKIKDEPSLTIRANQDSEVLLWDLD